MLIKKGFAWALVGEDGSLIEDMDMFLTYPTRNKALMGIQPKENEAVERVVKVKIEVIK